MKANKRSIMRAGLVAGSLLAVVLTGCRTRTVYAPPQTVYVPSQPQVVYVPAPAQPPVIAEPPQPVPQELPPPVIVAPPAQPPAVVIQSPDDFYQPLAPYGRWEVVASYGRVWVPGHVETGWRPYSNGHWERTDAGWYWASEEPWGWATYHYGRWDYQTQFGWIWIPQTQWAPAWVSWREGGGYVGWAPLPPSARVGPRGIVEIHEQSNLNLSFVFVQHNRMLQPVRPKTVIVNNTTIINKTVNITKVTVVNKTVINEGPRTEVIERETGRKVQSVPVQEARHREEAAIVRRPQNNPKPGDNRVQAPVRGETRPATPPVVTTPQKPTPPTPPTRPVRGPQNDIVVKPQPTTPIAPATPPSSPLRPTPPKVETTVTEPKPGRTPTAPVHTLPPQNPVVIKPTPPTAPANPVRVGTTKPEPVVTKRPAPTSPVVIPQPAKREERPPTKPNLPPSVQALRPTVQPVPLMSPKDKSREPEILESLMKQKAAKEQKQKSEPRKPVTALPGDERPTR